MIRVGLLHSRIRVEEKLLIEELNRHSSVEIVRINDGVNIFDITQKPADVDVVLDLMIHDLDILQQVLGEEPERIEAIGVPVVGPNVDIANARLVYPGGCVASQAANSSPDCSVL